MKIGIDLGGSHIAIGLVDDNLEIIEKRTYYMNDREAEKLEDYIVKSIKEGIKEITKSADIKLDEIEQIGIAVPGNPKGGCIKNVVNLQIEEFNIVEQLGIKNIPVKLENDGKCAALAEKYNGSLKEYKDCVFLCIGTGIGGAAFINNTFLKPTRNSGFEFGHMIIEKNGEQCKCGNRGCFEAYCSKRKFKQEMQEMLKIDRYVGAKELTEEIEKNIDKKAVKELLDKYVDNLAIGISNIINILEPEAVCIGGSMSHYEDLVLNKLREKISSGEYLFNKENPQKIIAAKNGNDAGIIGATLL